MNNFDKDKIMQGITLVLEGMGEDINREGLVGTPDRVARMYQEILAGMNEDPKEQLSRVFTAEGSDMVIEKDITFYSTCEHHLMPFFGKAHIAYIPADKVVGLSKLARCVETYAKRLQLQERLTSQIADAISENLNAKGVMVMLEAEHMCVSMRGIKKPGTITTTIATRGDFATDKNLQDTFLRLVR